MKAVGMRRGWCQDGGLECGVCRDEGAGVGMVDLHMESVGMGSWCWDAVLAYGAFRNAEGLVLGWSACIWSL